MAGPLFAADHQPGWGLLGYPCSALTFRILSASAEPQIVPVESGKCTIGSAPDCTVRIQSPELEPVHCLVLRGERGNLVRRWSRDTKLNGVEFDDALLKAGDTLSLGSVVIEVVDRDLSVPGRNATAFLSSSRSTAEAGVNRAENPPVCDPHPVSPSVYRTNPENLVEYQQGALQELYRDIYRRTEKWDQQRKRLIDELDRQQHTTAALQSDLDSRHDAWQHERQELEARVSVAEEFARRGADVEADAWARTELETRVQQIADDLDQQRLVAVDLQRELDRRWREWSKERDELRAELGMARQSGESSSTIDRYPVDPQEDSE